MQNLGEILGRGRRNLAQTQIFHDEQRHFSHLGDVVAPSRLLWVGSWGGLELYYSELQAMIKDLGIRNVVFTGHLSPPTLAACYHYSDIFAGTSDHEGFCVPIPGAVSETLGEAGILIDRRREPTYVETIHHMNNDTLTPALIALGDQRLSTHFGFANLAQLLKDYLFTFAPLAPLR